jgi:predicted aspartyl protease
MRVRFLGLFAVLAIVVTSRPLTAAAPTANSIPFTLTGTGQVLVPVTINGAGPFQFILDTGANRSAISDTLAARLALPPVALSEAVSATGSELRSIVRPQLISLGSYERVEVLTLVLAAATLHDVHPKAEGIVGQDMLIEAHYTVDYRRKRLTWLEAASESGAGTRLALRRADGRVLVELPQSPQRGDVALLVPDSGASTLVLFQRHGRTAISTTMLAATTQVSTVTGDAQVQAAVVPRLRIGTDTLWDQSAVLVAGPSGAEATGVDGLLPLNLFASVTFNGRGNYLVARR